MLVLNIGAPIALYYALHAAGVSNLVALGAGAVVPAVGVIVQLLTKRHLDGIGGFVVVTAVAAIVLSVITRSPRFCWPKTACSQPLGTVVPGHHPAPAADRVRDGAAAPGGPPRILGWVVR